MEGSISFIIVATILFLFFSLIWKVEMWYNIAIKMVLSILTIWGVILIIQAFI